MRDGGAILLVGTSSDRILRKVLLVGYGAKDLLWRLPFRAMGLRVKATSGISGNPTSIDDPKGLFGRFEISYLEGEK